MNHFENACEGVDACVFSSDMLFNDERRTMLKDYLCRWNRAVQQHEGAAVQGCVGNCASAAAKEYWERGNWADEASAEKLRHPLYAAQTLWSACAQAGTIERGKLEPLLRRSLDQLRKWAEWYRDADHAARGQLPPAGDVDLADDIRAALGPNVQVQPPRAAQEQR